MTPDEAGKALLSDACETVGLDPELVLMDPVPTLTNYPDGGGSLAVTVRLSSDQVRGILHRHVERATR